ncbi:hypothetical protein M406DRAFT_353130 [Cryphonectria parasitica EP155]|uniref:Clr5 domain-containing protein n=1 Tax=Cryphonectria parasitica (strain ATCC 38755 / EP155) TaxID=660469 RepID=A0A9P4XV12_CRYP1|nr:uncharacterized protein M406DRAFT_353130 [Cryphonectria parasitica EP155]KAF3761503.1 hypothetical protein M406DRAFT_353130 [Cryphonectria parasitica EP155]
MTKDWDRYKTIILALYKDQAKTLDQSRAILEELHGFKASVRAYRARLKKWDAWKYNKSQNRGEGGGSGVLRTNTTPYPHAPPPISRRSTSQGVRRLRKAVPLPRPRANTIPNVQYDLYMNSSSPASSTSSNYFGDQQQEQLQRYSPPMHSPSQAPSFASMSRQLSGQQNVGDYHIAGHHQQRQMTYHGPRYPNLQSPHQQYEDLDGTLLKCLFLPSSTELDQRLPFLEAEIQALANRGELDLRDHSRPFNQTAFELFVHTAATAQGTFNVKFFCRVSAAFVKHGANAQHLLPSDSNQAVHAIQTHSVPPSQTDPMGYHHHQLQEQQQQQQQQQRYVAPGGLQSNPAWISVWVQACVDSQRGNFSNVASLLPWLARPFGWPIDANELESFLPKMSSPGPEPYGTPESQNCQPMIAIWDRTVESDNTSFLGGKGVDCSTRHAV